MFTLNCKGKLLSLEKPVVMGIINTTPDSFYEGSRFENAESILQVAAKMLHDGASILDIGGQSTRPGSIEITIDNELARVIPAIQTIHNRFPDAILSIDTYHAVVAKEAIAVGASIVNDISSGDGDSDMMALLAGKQVPYICMHMKGNPATMQQQAVYENITRELLDYFIRKKYQCIEAGINDVIIDPGLGFAKTIAHNFELLKNLSVLQMPGCPIMIGVSRKSTIYKTLGITAGEALNGTTVLNTIALLNGANILRVHDVKEAMEAIRLVTAVNA